MLHHHYGGGLGGYLHLPEVQTHHFGVVGICQQQKGLKIYAWVLMSNHLHMIVSAGAEQTVTDIMRDFKKFTGKRILAELEEDPQESRREWMLDRFRFAGANDKKIT